MYHRAQLVQLAAHRRLICLHLNDLAVNATRGSVAAGSGSGAAGHGST
jgi:hypothetical protein